MRTPLQKFTKFTNTLLPTETEYLLSNQKFKDNDRLEILQRVDYNARHIDQFTPYDININKRKYNHLQNWISTRLRIIDVDEQFNKMMDWEQKIHTDSIQVEEEKELLKLIKKYDHPSFFFSKLFELIENYRHFLLIRLRYNDHQLADNFIVKYRTDYAQARRIKEKLHKSSIDVVGHYAGKGRESKQWEEWLTEIFYNESLEGHTRYLALVRLTFIAHNYRKYDLLKEKFEYIEGKIKEGFFYSKRLLANYYNNRLMLNSHFKEYDQAVYDGYLSIRTKTHDYLLYVNNLCAVLLRANKNQEALQLLQEALSVAKKTKNFHNRIGFVAFYLRALNKNGMYKRAQRYGDAFLKAYSKEILQYRWHLYFSVYFETIFHQAHFEKLLKIARKYRLLELDKSYQSNSNYLPILLIYIQCAHFREGNISKKVLYLELQSLFNKYPIDKNHPLQICLKEIKCQLPEISVFL